MAKKWINKLYFIALSLYLIAKYTEISTIYFVSPSFAFVMRVLRFIAYFLIIGVAILNISKKKTILIRYLLMITILITVSIIAKSVTLLFNFMFIFEARNIENKKLITFVVVMQVLIVGIIIIGCMQGVVPN